MAVQVRPFASVDAQGYYLLSDGSRSHFTTGELSCHCGCGAHMMDQRQIDVLEAVRTLLGEPVFPNSGVRCWLWNKKIGGAALSQHLPRTQDGVIVKMSGTAKGAGRATDITLKGMTPGKVYKVLDDHADELGIRGLGKYPGFVHLDTRDGRKARW